MKEAARVALRAVIGHLAGAKPAIKEVSFVLFDEDPYLAYSEALTEIGGQTVE